MSRKKKKEGGSLPLASGGAGVPPGSIIITAIFNNNFTPPGADGKPKFGPRIDYIYVSPGVRVKNVKTWNDVRPGAQLYPSDHFPITADIVL